MKIRTKLSAGLLILALLLSVTFYPDQAYAANSTTGTYKVTVSSLRVRSGAGTSYSTLGTVKKGATYSVTTVKKASDGVYWGRIAYGKKTGWISLAYCTKVTASTGSTSSGSTSSAVSYKVTNSYLRVRSGPGTSYKILGLIHKGDVYQVTATEKASNEKIWGKITYGKQTGWISLSYCTKVTASTDSASSGSASTGSASTGSASTGSSSSAVSYKVTSSDLRVRSGAGTSYKILGRIYKGDVYAVAATKKASNGAYWGQITYGKQTGWICLTYCTKVTETKQYANGSVVNTKGAASYKKTGSYLIGHRGSASDGCERETTESFTKAGEQGFWGIEGDLRLYNGTFVMAHSADDASASSCTLEAYLDICKKYGSVAVIDIKSMSDSASNMKKLVAIVKKKGMIDQTIFQCSVPSYLKVIRNESSDAHLWILTAHEDGMEKAIENAKTVKAEGINVNLECTGATDYIAAYKKAGYKTCVYHLSTFVDSSYADFKTSGADYYMCDKV